MSGLPSLKGDQTSRKENILRLYDSANRTRFIRHQHFDNTCHLTFTLRVYGRVFLFGGVMAAKQKTSVRDHPSNKPAHFKDCWELELRENYSYKTN